MFFKRQTRAFKPTHSICPYPFARMELNNEQRFVPCCSDWLKEDFFKIPVGRTPWNGPAAKQLRKSVLDGSYKYCKTEVCHFRGINPQNPNDEISSEVVLTEKNRQSILAGKAKMPDGPRSFTILNDARCNLACPSCREEHITTLKPHEEKNIKRVDALLMKHRHSIEVLKVAGDGEVFFSPWLKSVVKRIDKKTFPNFQQLDILSNGLLFNESMYQSLMPGAAFIKKVCISMDAGNEETYRRVRGGSWEKLLKNLRWIGDETRKGTFEYFQMNMTVQVANFESIPEFVELAKEMGASNVRLMAFFPFKRMALDYQSNAIHLPSHPRHKELYQVWRKIEGDPFVRWALPSFRLEQQFDSSAL